MPQVQAMTVQAKDVHAPAAGAKPAGLLFPLWAVGPRALAGDTESTSPPRARAARRSSLAALAGALAAAGLGSLGDADVTEIAISVAVATVNSAAEELLWRGVFLARYPRSVIAGCLYPSVLFGLSHLGPLSARPSKRGAAAFVAAATALGYVYGLEARSSRYR
jgi:membrane protease YdiL (CAAX protease family)